MFLLISELKKKFVVFFLIESDFCIYGINNILIMTRTTALRKVDSLKKSICINLHNKNDGM